MKKLLIIIGLFFFIGILGYFWFREGTMAVNKLDNQTKMFVIQKGQNVDTIARNLAAENLIRSRIVFFVVVKMMGYDKKIQAGSFRLSPSMNVYKVADELTHGTLDKWITVKEGLRKEEIAELFSEEFGIPVVEFNTAAKEGYLFPDTYLVPIGAKAETAVSLLTNTFNQKYTSEMAAQAKAKGFTQDEVVTLASIVEKEATANDRQEIADILYKRYKNDYPLQADATVQYALGYQPDEKRWWKKYTTLDDLKLKSPYNTYINNGLPPAPISNPGIAAIQAVLNANENTPYFFYLHDKNGISHFAKTYEEHQKNIQKYLQ